MQENTAIAEVTAQHEVIDPYQHHRPLGVNDTSFVVREERAAGETAAVRELADAVGERAGDRADIVIGEIEPSWTGIGIGSSPSGRRK